MKILLPSRNLLPFLMAALLPLAGFAQSPQAVQQNEAGARRRITDVRSGAFPVQAGGWLRLRTDLGSVRVTPHESAEVRYRVELDSEVAESSSSTEWLKQFRITAQPVTDGVEITGTVPWHEFRGRLWASFEVWIPRQYNLEVKTLAGNIAIGDIDGEVRLSTSGGNISAGEIRGPATFETQGGHITVTSVSRDLRAETAGGHVYAGSVGGRAVLRSAGGHIFAGRIGGQVEVETGGGNITLGQTGGKVTAVTAGGQIDFGKIAGAITARTGGGGIRVLQGHGPIQLESSAGSIQLLQVGGPVRVSTASGGITAFFLSGQELRDASELLCGQGDIVVYLPRNLPLTIDALIEGAAGHGVIAPGFPLNLRQVSAGEGGSTVHAAGDLNGGGQTLRLRTVSGNIRLLFADALSQLEGQRIRMQAEQLRRQLELQQQALHRLAENVQHASQFQHLQRQQEVHRIDSLRQRLLFRIFGYVRIAPDEQMKKLVYSVRPAYPESARLARVQGTVRMEILVGKDGRVEEIKVLEGPSLLIEAAREAVRQWRYAPTVMDDEPVPVLTTVNVEFRLD
jgi:TonB family protein